MGWWWRLNDKKRCVLLWLLDWMDCCIQVLVTSTWKIISSEDLFFILTPPMYELVILIPFFFIIIIILHHQHDSVLLINLDECKLICRCNHCFHNNYKYWQKLFNIIYLAWKVWKVYWLSKYEIVITKLYHRYRYRYRYDHH